MFGVFYLVGLVWSSLVQSTLFCLVQSGFSQTKKSKKKIQKRIEIESCCATKNTVDPKLLCHSLTSRPILRVSFFVLSVLVWFILPRPCSTISLSVADVRGTVSRAVMKILAISDQFRNINILGVSNRCKPLFTHSHRIQTGGTQINWHVQVWINKFL